MKVPSKQFITMDEANQYTGFANDDALDASANFAGLRSNAINNNTDKHELEQ